MSPNNEPRVTEGLSRRWNWHSVGIALSLFLATLMVYGQACSFGYMTVDDPAYVTANRPVQQGLTLQGIVWSFTNIHDSNWIPLTWISLMLDSSIYGVRPLGYHLTNVLLHATNGVLLFAALALATQSPVKSGFVAALFALHPLHAESVVWIAERKDVLSTFFGLLSLLTYVRYSTGGARWNLATSLLFLGASLLAKQTLVTLPFVFLLLDIWPLARVKTGPLLLRWPARPPDGASTESLRELSPPKFVRQRPLGWLIAEKIPFFAASLIFSMIAATAQSRGGAVRGFQILPLYARAMNTVSVYVLYLWKTIYPHALAIYYPYPQSELNASVVTLCAALLLAFTGIAVISFRRFPFLAVGWF